MINNVVKARHLNQEKTAIHSPAHGRACWLSMLLLFGLRALDKRIRATKRLLSPLILLLIIILIILIGRPRS